jgi:hypothetical protein
MILKTEEIRQIVDECDRHLKSMERISYRTSDSEAKKFPIAAGVYGIFDGGNLVYIGETANLRERMKDVKRTLNHSFRRKLGKKLFAGATIANGKFAADIEAKLDEYCIANISFSSMAVNFGRLEIESHLVHKNKGLLNSERKRNQVDRIYD